VILDTLFGVIFLVVLWLYSPTLTWIVLLSLPVYVGISFLVGPSLRRMVEELFARGAANQSLLVETVAGAETVKAMAVEPQMRNQWENQLAAYVQQGFRTAVLAAGGSRAVELVSRVVLVLVIWIGAYQVMGNKLTVGELVAFHMIAAQVSGPILRLAQLWQQFQQVRISIDRLGDILNTPVEPGGGKSGPVLPAVTGRISFERVGFRYQPDGREVLDGIDLDLAPGTVIGLVGRSGSGKSTLAKLIQRLYVPQRGRVLVDGHDLALADPAWLRRQIGVVLQDNILFNRSVRENIALADPSLPMERVVAAARIAGAHDFIGELAQGYDTVLEERGSNLSGGQRQRIAIARALVTDPRILILDEATSALDYESERHFQANYHQVRQDRTVVIVAHRLSTVMTADRIVVLDRGRIAEDGTPAALARAGGIFSELLHQGGGA
jgi:subfamily B ATP-binding cassette protein HlyB/CyaB